MCQKTFFPHSENFLIKMTKLSCRPVRFISFSFFASYYCSTSFAYMLAWKAWVKMTSAKHKQILKTCFSLKKNFPSKSQKKKKSPEKCLDLNKIHNLWCVAMKIASWSPCYLTDCVGLYKEWWQIAVSRSMWTLSCLMLIRVRENLWFNQAWKRPRG